MTARRLIEVTFPLKQTSIDSVHEKTVRHGHISTLHLWPARRPLAASRAALIATLLPDPETPEKRKEFLERLGGRLEPVLKRKKLPSGKVEEIKTEQTVGGVLRWGMETGPNLDWFRGEIRKAYCGRAPRVLDSFAGGGAIPLEAMRLGAEVTAVDINPVAWFVLKCTLEYPQKLAGQKLPLPLFALADGALMEAFFKSQGLKGALLRTRLERLQLSDDPSPQLTGIESGDPLLEADLAWHVRAWARWVLKHARRDLAKFYPTYAEFEPLGSHVRSWRNKTSKQSVELMPTDADGSRNVLALNTEFDENYLKDARNPRWVAKPTVAYLWARTVACKNCRAAIPLLKTRWLSKTDSRRVLLTVQPNADRTGVTFGIDPEVSHPGANAAARREHDKRVGVGTMSRSGAKCPCCNTIMEMEDIRLEGRAGRLGTVMTAVAVEGQESKEFRLPTADEIKCAIAAGFEEAKAFAAIPYGLPNESLPSKEALGFRVPLYGFDQWHKLFTARQRLALASLISASRQASNELTGNYTSVWSEAIAAYLACGFSRFLDFANMGVQWKIDVPTINHSFVRFALPITWDFAEGNPIGESAGSYLMCADRICTALDTYRNWKGFSVEPHAVWGSAIGWNENGYDLVLTDPPYYDAIPYSDLMDFFYVWLRRLLFGQSPQFDEAFASPLAPKWDHSREDGELIDDSSRFGGDKERSKRNYEEGMGRAFIACHKALNPDGRLVIVFAHKQPDAWETLVGAIIRAGFVVDASWPIQTEQTSRMRAIASAALASSVWLVCRKRSDTARPGWDNQVLQEMHTNITQKLREFWDAGIRGPDFVWAATGPALEAYSKHPVVKKANDPGQLMTVSEFLRDVRRIVVDFVVGRVLLGETSIDEASGLDDVTTYYLLHRHDFGMEDAPSGACILYALSCGLSDRELADQYDLLVRTGGREAPEEDEETENGGAVEEEQEGSGSKVKLKAWQQRKGRGLGYESSNGRAAPVIDQVHRLMHLWKTGEVVKVNEYLDSRALRQNKVFHQLLQALIELAAAGSEERALLEKLSNHVAARGVAPMDQLL